MNSILKKITNDLKQAMRNEVDFRKANITKSTAGMKVAVAQKTVSRSIISMIPQLGKKKEETTKEDIQQLLKKYISMEKERAVYQYGYLKESDVVGKSGPEVKKLVNDTILEYGDSLTSLVIEIAKKYLPKQASEDEIIEWINSNLDLSQFKNKMQAMGPIMKQFKGCNGNFVKGILLKM